MLTSLLTCGTIISNSPKNALCMRRFEREGVGIKAGVGETTLGFVVYRGFAIS